MKVAIFTETYYPFVSGVVTHIEILRNGLIAQGHEVLIVTADPNVKRQYMKDNILYCPGVTLKRVYGYGLATPVSQRRLSVIKRFAPDVIHVHTEFGMGLFGILCARRLNVPYVYTLHTMYDEYVYYMFPGLMMESAKQSMRKYIKRIAENAAEITGPSQKVNNYLRACGTKRRAHIIPNAAILDEFMPERSHADEVDAVRESLGIKSDDISLCFVGRMGDEKSVDVLILWFAQRARTDERLKLFLIGAGPTSEELEVLISNLNMQQKVKLLGRIEHENLPAYYQAFDLYTTASLTEIDSISTHEASAAGLYTLQRYDEPNKDQITKGVNGDFFTDADSFSALLDWYGSTDKAERAKIRSTVTAHAMEYGPDEFMENILEVYESAIANYTGRSKLRKFAAML